MASTLRLAKQIDEIDRLNAELETHRAQGIEVDILADGSLDLPDSVLSWLDLVVGAVHSSFTRAPSRPSASCRWSGRITARTRGA